MTKVFKMEVMAIMDDDWDEDSVIAAIENTKYVYPQVKSIQRRDIGDWSDDHPLNKKATAQAEYERLFATE